MTDYQGLAVSNPFWRRMLFWGLGCMSLVVIGLVTLAVLLFGHREADSAAHFSPPGVSDGGH